MTSLGDDAADDGGLDGAPEPARGRRGATWFVVGALALITVNIGIAAVGGGKKAVPAPTPTPVVTARPTGAAPTPEPSPGATTSSLPPRPEVNAPPASFAPTGVPVSLPAAAVAITSRGDIALVDPDTASVVVTLVTHQPGAGTADLSLDARARLVYFDRLGVCASVWSYSLKTGRVTRLVDGRHPVISPDGRRLAVVGTGCGPAGEQVDGLAVYAARSRAPLFWSPLGDFPTTGGHLPRAGIVDVDWLPDSSAIAVTVTSGENTEHHLINVSTPSRGDIRSAPRLAIDTAIPGSYPEIAYAVFNGQPELFMSGSCCADTSPPGTNGLRTESGARFEGTPDGPASSLTANASGDLLYLASDGTGAGELCGPGRGCRGGAFVRIDW